MPVLLLAAAARHDDRQLGADRLDHQSHEFLTGGSTQSGKFPEVLFYYFSDFFFFFIRIASLIYFQQDLEGKRCGMWVLIGFFYS